MARVR